MQKAVCYFGMTVRQMYDCVLLESSIGHADRNINPRRKFVRSIVTMAGLTTTVAKSVAKLFENGIQLLGNDCRNLDITCSRSLGSLLVMMMPSMGRTRGVVAGATLNFVSAVTSDPAHLASSHTRAAARKHRTQEEKLYSLHCALMSRRTDIIDTLVAVRRKTACLRNKQSSRQFSLKRPSVNAAANKLGYLEAAHPW
jgi:hypothetical protein